MANQFDPYAEFGGAKPGSSIPYINTGMTAQPTAMMSPVQPTSQELGLGTGQEGALTSRFASRQGGLGSIEPRPIDSLPTSGGHGDDHGAVSHPKSKSMPKEEKLGFWKSLKAFGKGLISPITNMFSSPGNFLKGIACIGLGIAACIAFPVAAPVILVAAGAVLGGYQVVKGGIDYSNAHTAEEKEAALEGMGAGTFAVVGSAVGANALAGAGAPTGVVGAIRNPLASARNIGQTITRVPTAARNVYQIAASGEATANLSEAYAGLSNYSVGLRPTTPRPAAPTAVPNPATTAPPATPAPPPRMFAGYNTPATPTGRPPRLTFMQRQQAALADALTAHNAARQPITTRHPAGAIVNGQRVGGQISGRITPTPAAGAYGSAEYATQMARFENGLAWIDATRPLVNGQYLNFLGTENSAEQFFGDIATA